MDEELGNVLFEIPDIPKRKRDFPNNTRKNVANRTTKISQKLAFFPEEAEAPQDLEFEGEDYNQADKIEGTESRKQATLVSKYLRRNLPRVTVYLTANEYDMDSLFWHLKQKKFTNLCIPRIFDEW